jgi:hypothetical protein
MPASAFKHLVDHGYREHHHDHVCSQARAQRVLLPEVLAGVARDYGRTTRQQRTDGHRS